MLHQIAPKVPQILTEFLYGRVTPPLKLLPKDDGPKQRSSTLLSLGQLPTLIARIMTMLSS